MAQTNVDRLVALSMVPELAKEVATQMTRGGAITALTPIATVDATDLATVLTLANATKAKVNAIIAALNA